MSEHVPAPAMSADVASRKLTAPALAIVLAWLVACAPAVSGQSATSTEPASADATLTNIPAHLEKSLAVVRRITQNRQSSEVLDEIARDLPDFSKRVRDFEEATMADPSYSRSTISTALLRGAWANADASLTKWQSAVVSESLLLQQDLKTLNTEARLLSEERRQLDGSQIQSALVSTIDRVLAQITRASEVARSRRNTLLALHADITEIEIRVHLVQQSLRETATISISRLFALDSPPLWQLTSANSASPAQKVSMGKAAVASPFFFTYMAKVLLRLVLVYLTFVISLFVLRRRLGPLVPPPRQTGALQQMLGRPLSAAFIPAFFAVDLFRGQIQLNVLPLIIPLLRVIPILLPPGLLLPLRGFAVIVAVDWAIMQYSPSQPAWMHVVQFLRIGLTLGWLIWLRSALHAEPALAGHRAVWSPLSWMALTLTTAAMVSSGVGATALGRYLVSGLVRSIFGGVLVYGLFRLSDTLLQAFIASRSARTGASTLWSSGVLSSKLSTVMSGAGVAGIAAVTLSAFELDAPFFSAVKQALSAELNIGAVSFTLGSIGIIVVILLIGAFLSRVLRFLITTSLQGRIALQRGTSEVVSKLIHYSVMLLAVIFALSASGLDLNRFTLLAGALGVGLGFGLQNIVNNFICGLILLFERPIKVGDIVAIDNITGMVIDIGIRSTQIRTWDGAEISVPNANVVSKELTNWRDPDEQRGSELMVGVAYGTDAERVISILTDTASRHSLVLPAPPPSAFVSGFGDSSINFTLRYWTLIRDRLDINSQMYSAVHRRFEEEGVEIPFPQREFRMRNSEDPANAKPDAHKQASASNPKQP